MTTAATARRSITPHKEWRRERAFFTAMALAAGLAVFVGFARTYYLKPLYGTPPLPWLVHAHGLLFTAWIILLIVQTCLIGIKRTDLHRRMGVFGAILASVMTVVAYFTAIGALHRGKDSAEFLIVPLTSVVLFPTFVAAALLMRRNPDSHKRLMFIATAELLLAAVGRWPVVQYLGALGDYAVTDTFIVALLAYDFVTRRRPHPATVWAGLIFIGSQPLRQWLGGTTTWLTFVHWLAG